MVVNFTLSNGEEGSFLSVVPGDREFFKKLKISPEQWQLGGLDDGFFHSSSLNVPCLLNFYIVTIYKNFITIIIIFSFDKEAIYH